MTPNKDKNHSFLLKFLFCFLWSAATLSIIYSFAAARGGGRIFSFKHAVILLLCCIPLSVLYALFVEKSGSIFGNLLTGWSERESHPREQLSADMARARFSKGKKQYKEALIIINEVLDKDPDFPEALFLKAQIVWEGYGNKELARRNLDKILKLVADDDPVRRWVINYYHDIGKIKE